MIESFSVVVFLRIKAAKIRKLFWRLSLFQKKNSRIMCFKGCSSWWQKKKTKKRNHLLVALFKRIRLINSWKMNFMWWNAREIDHNWLQLPRPAKRISLFCLRSEKVMSSYKQASESIESLLINYRLIIIIPVLT